MLANFLAARYGVPVKGATLNRQIMVGTIGVISVTMAAISYFFPWFGAMTMMLFGMVMAEEIVKSYPPSQ